MSKKIKFVIPQKEKIKKDDLLSLLEEDNQEIIVNPPKLITKKQKKKNNIKKINSIITTIPVIIFIILTIFILFNILNNLKPIKNDPIKKIETKLSNNITGSWQTTNNGLFIFNKDETFYWYNHYNELDDNYYKGTYNYKTGEEALKEMGYTEEEFKKEYGSEINLDNIYSINLFPYYVQKSKIDITFVELNQNETWWYILIIKEDNTANGYNKALDLKYNLVKRAE